MHGDIGALRDANRTVLDAQAGCADLFRMSEVCINSAYEFHVSKHHAPLRHTAVVEVGTRTRTRSHGSDQPSLRPCMPSTNQSSPPPLLSTSTSTTSLCLLTPPRLLVLPRLPLPHLYNTLRLHMQTMHCTATTGPSGWRFSRCSRGTSR